MYFVEVPSILRFYCLQDSRVYVIWRIGKCYHSFAGRCMIGSCCVIDWRHSLARRSWVPSCTECTDTCFLRERLLLCDGLQVRFGKTRLAVAMRNVYDQPKTLVWGAQLTKKYRKAYAMAEVTPCRVP